MEIILQQLRPTASSSQKRGVGLAFFLGLLAVLFGAAFLLKLTGMFRLPIPIDDSIFQYATSVFSIIGGLYMMYKAFYRPRIYL